MRRTAWVVTAAVTAAVVVGGARIMDADGQESSDRGRGKQCSEATVRGDYGIQIQGTRPAPGGLIESVIGVVLRNYDGHGSFSQVSNVKGSITGTVPDSQGSGTYEVNADCTGVVRFQPAPRRLARRTAGDRRQRT
jgi:archaellin